MSCHMRARCHAIVAASAAVANRIVNSLACSSIGAMLPNEFRVRQSFWRSAGFKL